MTCFTVILYSLPDGEALVEWQEAKTPTHAVKEILKRRNLIAKQVEVIAIFRGWLCSEHTQRYRLFPPG